MDAEHPACTPGLRFYQWMMEKNRTSRLRNQRLLRKLRGEHLDRVEVCCSHDVVELERLSGASAEIPAERLTTRTRVAP